MPRRGGIVPSEREPILRQDPSCQFNQQDKSCLMVSCDAGAKRSEEIVCGAVLAEIVIIEDQGLRERKRVRQCHSLPENFASRSVSRSARWPRCSWLRWLRSGRRRLGCRARAAPVGSKEPAESRRHQAGGPWNPDHRPRGSVPGLSRGGVPGQARPRALDPGRRGVGRSEGIEGGYFVQRFKSFLGTAALTGRITKTVIETTGSQSLRADAGME